MTAAADAKPPTRPFYWSVRRELWEIRSLYVAPLIAAALVLFGFSISALRLPQHRLEAMKLDAAGQTVAITLPYHFAAAALIVTMLIVAAFYCLGALHNERRDRSILFWKSLPVSDLTVVLSKASVPLVVLPAINFAVILATQAIMLAISTLSLASHGMDAGLTFQRLPILGMPVALLYALAVLALWYAPIWAWLLMVSGWARRAPFLWAVLPPLALVVVEKIAFDTGHVAALLTYRFNGFADAFEVRHKGDMPLEALPGLDIGRFLSLPGLWAGLAVAAAFLAVAVWQRRYREPV